MQFKDLSGQYFHRWHVIERAPNLPGKNTAFHCRCECGTERIVSAGNLSNHKTLGCGCDANERISKANTKHGMSRHPAYTSRLNMLARCYNPDLPKFKSYGARGITVCDAWRDSFEAFWADMGATYQDGLTLERIDVNGNYEPSNCTWIPAPDQANNKRKHRIVQTPLGPMNVGRAAKQYGFRPDILYYRLKNGWPEADILAPVGERDRDRFGHFV